MLELYVSHEAKFALEMPNSCAKAPLGGTCADQGLGKEAEPTFSFPKENKTGKHAQRDRSILELVRCLRRDLRFAHQKPQGIQK